MNYGDKPFNFGPENVTGKLADGTPFTIITYERLVHEEKRSVRLGPRLRWASPLLGIR